MKGQGLLCCEGLDVISGNDACGSVVEVVEGAGSGQGAKGSASTAKRPAVQSVRERWLPVTGVAIGVLSAAAILLSAGLIVLRLRLKQAREAAWPGCWPTRPDLPGHARREREQAQWDLCRAIR